MNRIILSAAAVIATSALALSTYGQATQGAAGGTAGNMPGNMVSGPNGELLFPGQTEVVANVKVPAGMKGQLAEVDVKEGQAVKKGDVLAKLDDSVQMATVELKKQAAESTAGIRYSQNQVVSAQNEYDRLIKSGVTSASEVEQKSLAVKQAKLSVEAEQEKQREAQLDLKREQITLDHMTIRSPMEGLVLRVNKRPGEETDEDPLVTVVQTTRLSAIFFLPKQVFGKIHVGEGATLRIEDKTRDAKVISVDPIIDNELFRVKMEFDNADGAIPAGTSATWVWKDKGLAPQ